jgi:hypothetical protein
MIFRLGCALRLNRMYEYLHVFPRLELTFIVGLPEKPDRFVGAPFVFVCAEKCHIVSVQTDTRPIEPRPILLDDNCYYLISTSHNFTPFHFLLKWPAAAQSCAFTIRTYPVLELSRKNLLIFCFSAFLW